jgi:hypothetical protein
MSRAMNLKLPEAAVRERCQKSGVSISAIEVLPSGGTHLVCLTSEGADEMRHSFRNDIISGRVNRYAFYATPRLR